MEMVLAESMQDKSTKFTLKQTVKKWRNNYNSGRQNSSSPKCNYCKKPGHKEQNCWKKNGKPNGNQSTSNQPLRQQKKVTTKS